MGRPGVGNPGNRGGGRKSAFEEMKLALRLKEAWEEGLDVEALKERVSLGKNGRKNLNLMDLYLAYSLKDKKVLMDQAKKLIPDKIEEHSTGELKVTVTNYRDEDPA